MKIIVTHTSPDIDAITSIWLIHRFLPGWKEAVFKFVPAGETLHQAPVDTDTNIIHVDTGFGRFDHHQGNKDTCAATLVFEYLSYKKHLKNSDIPALQRLVDVINRYDHFREVFLDEPNDDMHDLSLKSAIAGLRIKLQDDGEVMRICEPLLDGVLINLKNKIHAEEIIDIQGHTYVSYWGKTLAVETENDEVLQLAAKIGFEMAIRKSKQHGHVRIKLHPKSKKNLNKLYALLTKEDDKATWYYHPSKKMLLNISSKNRNFKATKLSLNRIIEITKHIT